MKTTKSQRRIINAFLQLRAGRELEKITVVELCRLADVNKSTFYAYFNDVYALSEYLERDLIERIALTISHPENVIEDVEQFTKDILLAYQANREMILTLYSGRQSSRLPAMIKERIVRFLQERKVRDMNDAHERLLLDYKIYGVYYAFVNNMDINEAVRIEEIGSIAGEGN